jgi:hypothetical protein
MADIIRRTLEDIIIKRFKKGKVIILLGPRQVGKTTLSRQIADKSGMPSIWLNGDEPDIREILPRRLTDCIIGSNGT